MAKRISKESVKRQKTSTRLVNQREVPRAIVCVEKSTSTFVTGVI